MKGGVEMLICHTYSSPPDDVRKSNTFGSQISYILNLNLKIRVYQKRYYISKSINSKKERKN